jgi:molybdopterin adenylyltransferase
MRETPRIGIVTVSDRASQGVYEDLGGPAIAAVLDEWLATPWEAERRLIPDDQPTIEACFRELAGPGGCCLILVTGGTGPSPRDVTPDALQSVATKLLPGFGEQMRAHSLRYVPTAILSRQAAGIVLQALVVLLPGKPKSIRECLEAVFPAIPYCVDLIGGPRIETRPDSPVTAFRPKGA